jgi:hypothetical protein
MSGVMFALGLNGLIFVALGLAFLAAPERLLRGVDVTVTSRIGRTEVTAMYGGLELGFGAACLFGLQKLGWHEPLLFASTAMLFGLGLTRLAGVLRGGGSKLMVGLVAIELGGAALNSAFLNGALG